jgi:hypothetical protein
VSFSLSTFTLDIDGKPMLVLRAKWQADADEICRAWVQAHWDELTSEGPYGAELPPAIKLRMARAAEKAAYETNAHSALLFHDVSIVMLTERSDEPQDSGEPTNDPEQGPGGDVRKPIELPPAVAHAFVEDMRAYFAEENPIKRTAMASRPCHAPPVQWPSALRRDAHHGCF